MTCMTETMFRVKMAIIKALNIDLDCQKIPNDAIILGGGIGIESITTLKLICEIEEEFNIQIEDEELQVEALESVITLSEYVTTLLKKRTE